MTQNNGAASMFGIGLHESVRQALSTQFPVDEVGVASRPGDDFRPRYAKFPALVRRLNEITGHDWSTSIDQIWHSPDNREVLVKVSLTFCGWVSDPDGRWHRVPITKAGIGQAFLKVTQTQQGISYFDYGKDLKAAVSDGIRKAATLLGVGLHLYEGDESPFQGYPSHEAAAAASGPAHAFQVQQIHEFFGRYGLQPANWMPAVGLQPGQAISQSLAAELISGQHAYVRDLLAKAGGAPIAGMRVR